MDPRSERHQPIPYRLERILTPGGRAGSRLWPIAALVLGVFIAGLGLADVISSFSRGLSGVAPAASAGWSASTLVGGLAFLCYGAGNSMRGDGGLLSILASWARVLGAILLWAFLLLIVLTLWLSFIASPDGWWNLAAVGLVTSLAGAMFYDRAQFVLGRLRRDRGSG